MIVWFLYFKKKVGVLFLKGNCFFYIKRGGNYFLYVAFFWVGRKVLKIVRWKLNGVVDVFVLCLELGFIVWEFINCSAEYFGGSGGC